MNFQELSPHGLDLFFDSSTGVKGPDNGPHVLGSAHSRQTCHTPSNNQDLGWWHFARSRNLAWNTIILVKICVQ